MSEIANAQAAPSAGRLLREARERQGLHIAALAASIKVAPRKLELLEADRFDALPDATFTRALAQTVCRALKIDPGAVLLLLPPPAGHRLEQVSEGLNAPFRERPGVGAQRESSAPGLGPVFWVTASILAASLVLYFLPSGWLSLGGWRSEAPAIRPGATPTAVAPAPVPTMPGLPATPQAGEPTAPAAEAAPPGADPVAVPPVAPPASG